MPQMRAWAHPLLANTEHPMVTPITAGIIAGAQRSLAKRSEPVLTIADEEVAIEILGEYDPREVRDVLREVVPQAVAREFGAQIRAAIQYHRGRVV